MTLHGVLMHVARAIIAAVGTVLSSATVLACVTPSPEAGEHIVSR